MAPWLVPALKAILPHLADIIAVARPVFSSRKINASANQLELVQKQIEELQVAASQNSLNTKDLAAQLKEAISAIEHGAVSTEKSLRRAIFISFLSLGIAVVAVLAALSVLIWR